MTEDEKQRIATFRFSIIGEMVSGRLDPGEQERLIREKSRRKWQIPFSSRTHVSRSTLLRWIRQYRKVAEKSNPFIPMIETTREGKGYR